MLNSSHATSSQPASLGLFHSKSHSNPIQTIPGSKIPVYVKPIYSDKRRSRSSSPPQPDKPEGVVLDQRSPEEDSSLFNISNISTASSGSCSNSSYSLSGSTPAPLLSGNDGSGSVIMVETSADHQKTGYLLVDCLTWLLFADWCFFFVDGSVASSECDLILVITSGSCIQSTVKKWLIFF